MLKVGYFADGPWAYEAFKLILKNPKLNIIFVMLRYAAPDSNLRQCALAHGIPVLTARNVNAPNELNRLADFGCDIFVSMSFDQIIREKLRELPPHGFINCHASALPKYRGRNVVNWALINGEDEIGITVHHIDEGIDTGDIIIQQKISVSQDTNYGDIIEKLYVECALTLNEALTKIENGTDARFSQASLQSVGFYCSKRKCGDEWLDWSWPTNRLHNFIRGIAPPAPGARFVLGGKVFAAIRSQIPEHSCDYIDICGSVIGRKGGIDVKTGDTWIHISEVAEVQSDDTLGPGFQPTWPLGTRLGNGPPRQTDRENGT